MRVDAFDFELPEDLIALEPARPRDSARLLHVDGMRCGDHVFRDLANFFAPGDILVVNDTKVLPAQLVGKRPARDVRSSDINVDVTLLKQTSISDTSLCWSAFIRPAKRVQVGDRLIFADGFEAQVIQRDGPQAVLEFALQAHDFFAHLTKTGMPPLPPYIARKRGIHDVDKDDYQTRFARHDGSVAAPTAGLHFTRPLLDQLEKTGVKLANVTLHVGAGTFLPVSVDDTSDHVMHSEWGSLDGECADLLANAKAQGNRITAVGTTSLRLLESAARKSGSIAPFEGETDIFITPGYEFKVADRLITNFHLPRSTLFMLVCAFAGYEPMKRAYAHAIDQAYRFYSYGDGSLLELAKS